jgi:hypothetical protein
MHDEVDVHAAVEPGDCCDEGIPAPVNQVGSYSVVGLFGFPVEVS